jgi:hypothetical protein
MLARRRYESVAGELQQIAKHNDSIERYERTCAVLRDWVMNDAPVAQPGQKPGVSGTDEARAIYDNARLQSLVGLAAEGLLDLQPGKERNGGSRIRLRSRSAARHSAPSSVPVRAQ